MADKKIKPIPEKEANIHKEDIDELIFADQLPYVSER